MKQSNMKAARFAGSIKHWFGGNMGIMRNAWSLYRAVAGRAAAFAGVLLVLPYALLIFLTMRAVSFDAAKGLQLLTGVGYAGDWANMIYGRLQALSSLSSLISYATDLFLMPCACAAFAYIFSMRWQGYTLPLKGTWEKIKPLLLRIIIAGVAVMFISNFAELAVSMISGLLSMVASLLMFIPVLGPVIYYIVYGISMLLVLALALLSLAVLMFTMLTMAGENGGRGQLMMSTVRIAWGGRRDIVPSLLWLLTMTAAIIVAGAAIYGILFSIVGATSALIIIMVVLALVACAAIPLACSFLTVVYMGEVERQGGRTYIYTQHN